MSLFQVAVRPCALEAAHQNLLASATEIFCGCSTLPRRLVNSQHQEL